MISTTDDGGAPFIFAHDWKATVATDIVKTPNDIVLRKDQKDGIGADIVSIIRSRLLVESTTVSYAVPRLPSEHISEGNT